jgi:hypothetical protein
LRLDWRARALDDLQCAAEWSRGQGEAVVNAMEWMARDRLHPRPVDPPHDRALLTSPLGVIYRVEGGQLLRVLRVVDNRQRRGP